jgi:hypothetical protein
MAPRPCCIGRFAPAWATAWQVGALGNPCKGRSRETRFTGPRKLSDKRGLNPAASRGGRHARAAHAPAEGGGYSLSATSRFAVCFRESSGRLPTPAPDRVRQILERSQSFCHRSRTGVQRSFEREIPAFELAAVPPAFAPLRTHFRQTDPHRSFDRNGKAVGMRRPTPIWRREPHTSNRCH